MSSTSSETLPAAQTTQIDNIARKDSPAALDTTQHSQQWFNRELKVWDQLLSNNPSTGAQKARQPDTNKATSPVILAQNNTPTTQPSDNNSTVSRTIKIGETNINTEIETSYTPNIQTPLTLEQLNITDFDSMTRSPFFKPDSAADPTYTADRPAIKYRMGLEALGADHPPSILNAIQIQHHITQTRAPDGELKIDSINNNLDSILASGTFTLNDLIFNLNHELHLSMGIGNNTSDIYSPYSVFTSAFQPNNSPANINDLDIVHSQMGKKLLALVDLPYFPDFKNLADYIKYQMPIHNSTTPQYSESISQEIYKAFFKPIEFLGLLNNDTDKATWQTITNLARSVDDADREQAIELMRTHFAKGFPRVTAETLRDHHAAWLTIAHLTQLDQVRDSVINEIGSPDGENITLTTAHKAPVQRLLNWAAQTRLPTAQEFESYYSQLREQLPVSAFEQTTNDLQTIYQHIRGDITEQQLRQYMEASPHTNHLLESIDTLQPAGSDQIGFSNQTEPLKNQAGPQSALRPGGDTSGTSFGTTPFGTLNPGSLNPNGIIGDNGSQAGQDGNGGRGNAPTAVAAPGEDNPFSNSIPEAGAVLPQTPNVFIPGGWQMPAPGELLNGVFIPDTAPAPEGATSPSSEPAEGPSISYTPSEAGGVTIGGQLGSPGEAEKANTEMEQLLGKGWRQGVRPNLFPTPVDSRIPGFGEGVPPADVGSNDTRWGLPDEPITLPESEGFPEKDPVLDNILNPNGVGRPQFTFPPIKEGSRIPEVPAEAQAALIKALPELQGIRYAQFSQLSAADQQQVIPRTQEYQQLAPNDKTNISLIEYLDSGKTSPTQRQQLSQFNAAQTVQQAQFNTLEARTGLDSSTLGLINARINALQASTAQLNQQTQSIQQSNATRLSALASQAKTDPMGVAFIKPESTPQSAPERGPDLSAAITQNAPIPRFMVIRTENGPQLIENLANGQNQLHAYPLPADTPITRQESNGSWSGVPDVGQIGSRLFLDLLFTNGALKMLNNGNPVQAPGSSTAQPQPVNPQPAF